MVVRIRAGIEDRGISRDQSRVDVELGKVKLQQALVETFGKLRHRLDLTAVDLPMQINEWHSKSVGRPVGQAQPTLSQWNLFTVDCEVNTEIGRIESTMIAQISNHERPPNLEHCTHMLRYAQRIRGHRSVP